MEDNEVNYAMTSVGPFLMKALDKLREEEWASSQTSADAIDSVERAIRDGVYQLLHALPSALQAQEPLEFGLGAYGAVVFILMLPHTPPENVSATIMKKYGVTYSALIEGILKRPELNSYRAHARWMGHIVLCSNPPVGQLGVFISIVPLQPLAPGNIMILTNDFLTNEERTAYIQKNPSTYFSNGLVGF